MIQAKLKKFPIDRWFSLPTLGRDTFRELMQCGVKYDKKYGFKISAGTDLERFASIVSNAVGEEIEILKSCYICDEPLESERADSTLCENCLKLPEAFTVYSERFETQVQSLKD